MSNFEAALARARQRAESEFLTVTREFYGETFKFNFKPRATPGGVEIIGRLGEQADLAAIVAGNVDAAKLDVLLTAVTEFLDEQATDDTSDHIAELMRAGVIGIRELLDIQREVIESVAGRPTTSAPSSPEGSSTPGPSSTDGALSTESMPPPSPSTVS